MAISSEVLMADKQEEQRKARVREAMERIRQQRESIRQGSNYNQKVAAQIESQLSQSGIQPLEAGEYMGSRKQIETYQRLVEKDKNFAEYIAETYGSYENYLRTQKIVESESVYDPTIHYIIDVRIKTEEKSYNTDHISAEEVIMEALSGVCTVVFMKNDGSVRRLTGTLQGKIIPVKERSVRRRAFAPLQGDRILMWDLNESAWKSFYMERVIKFIRDDSIGLE